MSEITEPQEPSEAMRTPLIFYDSSDQHRRMDAMAAFLEKHADLGRFAIQGARLLARDLRAALAATRAASPDQESEAVEPTEALGETVSEKIRWLGNMGLPLPAQVALGEIYADVCELERSARSPSDQTNGLLREALVAERLLASIWFYGSFKAETHNERLLQEHMKRVGLWPIKNEADLLVKIDAVLTSTPTARRKGAD